MENTGERHQIGRLGGLKKVDESIREVIKITFISLVGSKNY